jgi:ABC-2 type transport system ATP-binding protein
MIEVESLRKEYGELVAVDDVSFGVEAGQIFGLLGPNGAGKSTAISCMSGLVKPTAGRVRIMGRDIVADGAEARRPLGVVPQELAIYEDLSARENLHYWGAAYGLRGADLKERVRETLEFVALLDRADEPVSQFSGGMKRRLNFACAMVHRPQVLLLDEPTVAVDPQSRVRLLDMVRELAAAGTCVLYTTHYMEEAESLCDRLAIIDRGQIIAHGTLADLRAQVGGRDTLRLSGSFDAEKARQALVAIEGVEVLQVDSDLLRLALPQASRHLARLLDALVESGAEVRETVLSQPSLESLFIQLTGKELRE